MTLLQSSWNDTVAFSDTCVQFSLATGVAQTYTVPGTSALKYQALFSYTASSNVYVGYNVAATSPGAGTKTSSPNIEFRPERRFVNGGDVLSFITPDASASMGVSLRTIPG